MTRTPDCAPTRLCPLTSNRDTPFLLFPSSVVFPYFDVGHAPNGSPASLRPAWIPTCRAQNFPPGHTSLPAPGATKHILSKSNLYF